MRAALALLAWLLAGPAVALTCLPPDPVRLYERAAASEERYVVVYGALDLSKVRFEHDGGYFDPPCQQKRIYSGVPLRGLSLTRDGFALPFDRPITLRFACFGPWCSGRTTEAQQIVFLRKLEQGGYELEFDPCGGWAYETPDPAEVDRLVQCHRSGRCNPRQR